MDKTIEEKVGYYEPLILQISDTIRKSGLVPNRYLEGRIRLEKRTNLISRFFIKWLNGAYNPKVLGELYISDKEWVLYVDGRKNIQRLKEVSICLTNKYNIPIKMMLRCE